MEAKQSSNELRCVNVKMLGHEEWKTVLCFLLLLRIVACKPYTSGEDSKIYFPDEFSLVVTKPYFMKKTSTAGKDAL